MAVVQQLVKVFHCCSEDQGSNPGPETMFNSPKLEIFKKNFYVVLSPRKTVR